MNQNLIELYKNHCKPKLASMLETIRLDMVYHKAVGDKMFYRNEKEEEIEILDFLGGYGASFFGHNHPKLIEVAKENLENQIPFNAQASCRGHAAKLAQKLSQYLQTRTKKQYVVTFASTGTEAVEAALKHSEYARYSWVENSHRELKKHIITLQQRLKKGDISLSPTFFQSAQEILGTPSDTDFASVAMALRTHNLNVFKKPPFFLALKDSFHGKTTGSVQLTYHEEYRIPFNQIGPRVIFLDASDNKSIDAAIEKTGLSYFWLTVNDKKEIVLEQRKHANITALVVEPLQGEGGIRITPKSFLEYARAMASQHQFHLVFDEIQCGMGRTGTFLFSEQLGVVADYYLLSKSLGGGLSKLSALLISDELYQPEFGYIHSSTFAEDDHSARIGLAAMELLQQDTSIMKNCIDRGEQLKAGLLDLQKKFPGVIKEVRGVGLMLGIEFDKDNHHGSAAIRHLSVQKLLGFVLAGYLLHEHHIRVAPTLSNNAVIRLEPSAYISAADCQAFLRAMGRLCEVLYKQNVFHLCRFIVGAEKVDDRSEIQNFRKVTQRYVRPDYAKRVAFLGHFIEVKDMTLWDEGFGLFSKEQLELFLDRVHEIMGPVLTDQKTVKSVTGDLVNMNFIGFCVDSRIIGANLMNGGLAKLQDKMAQGVDIATNLGCSVVGFGGFTSIITRNCEQVVTDSIALTSGNSLTAAMGVRAIHEAAEEAGIDLYQSTFAALGANGNICRVYSEIMAEDVPRLILLGKPGSEIRLREVASEIYFQAFKEILAHRFPVLPTTSKTTTGKGLKGLARKIAETNTVEELLTKYNQVDRIGTWIFDRIHQEMKDQVPIRMAENLDMLKEANLIVGATNFPFPLIYPQHLGKGPIVICDISVPADVDESVHSERKDVKVIQGGIVRLPLNPEFTIKGIPLESGQSFACMAETMLLGLTGINEHYSFGRIHKIRVKKIMELAELHGFSLARCKTERSI